MAAFIEGVVVESMAQLEQRIRLRGETEAMAELSGKLHRTQEHLTAQQQANLELAASVRKWVGIGKALGAGIGATVVIALAAVGAYRDAFAETPKVSREIAAEEAKTVAEAKTAPLELRSTNTDVRITAVEGRQSALESEVKAVRQSTDRILELLEQPTSINVPTKGMRTR